MSKKKKRKLKEDERWLKSRLYSDGKNSAVSMIIYEWSVENYDKLGIQHPDIQKLDKLRCLNCIITNLYVGWNQDQKLLVNMNSNRYRANRSYGRTHFTYDIVMNVVHALFGKKYIRKKKGYYDRDLQEGDVTRVWPSRELEEFFLAFTDREFFLFNPLSTEVSLINVTAKERDQVIVLKNDKRESIPLGKRRRSKPVIRMFKNLHRYNSMISKHQITLDMGSVSTILPLNVEATALPDDVQIIDDSVTIKPLERSERKQLMKQRYWGKGKLSFDLPNANKAASKAALHSKREVKGTERMYGGGGSSQEQTEAKVTGGTRVTMGTITNKNRSNSIENKEIRGELYRVFNNNSFTQGGRFYNPRYQTLNKKVRKHLLIDDKPVVELDYSALHISILYHQKGIEVNEDPYELVYKDKELRESDKKKLRSIFKLITNIALNAENYGEAIFAADDELKKDRELYSYFLKEEFTIKKLMNEFFSVHGQLEEYFYSGIGVTLQYKDSRIAEDILIYFTEKDIPVLCVHDSFIIQSEYKQELLKVMKDTYRKHFGFDIRVKEN